MNTRHLIPLALGFLAPLAPAQTLVSLPGSAADYEATRQTILGGTPTLESGAGDAPGLALLANEAIPGLLLDESRPIFQFNLAALGILDPDTESVVAHATLRLTLLEAPADPDFGWVVHGLGANSAAAMVVGTPEARAQFTQAGYAALTSALDPIVATYTLDLAPFLQDRLSDYLATGDGWIYLRLQPDTPIAFGNNISTSLLFASADHPDLALAPQLDLVLIPESRHATLIISLFVVISLFVSHRKR